MRILVTGSRSWTYEVAIEQALLRVRASAGDEPVQMTLVHGDASGVDRIAARLAEGMGWSVEPHPADWTGPCRDTCRPGHRRQRWDGEWICPAAGVYRNQEMVDLGLDLCLAFIKHQSRGASDCAERAEKAGARTVRVRA